MGRVKLPLLVAWFYLLWFIPASIFPQHGQAVSTPIPDTQACSKANRLNIRAGPGTNYVMSGVLPFGTCSPVYEINADKTWVRIQGGWVAMQYVTIQTPTPENTRPGSTPTPRATRTPESTQATIQAATALPTATHQPTYQERVDQFNALMLKMPMIIFSLAGFYLGMLATRRRSWKLWLAEGLLLFVVLLAFEYYWSNYLALPIYTLGSLPRLGMTLSARFLMPVCYLIGSGYTLLQRPRQHEAHADTKCSVCGRLQRRSRMRECIKCHQLYCEFPAWQRFSLRTLLDGIILWIAVPLFVVLTAFSILGGVIIIAFLAIPYFMLRELLPERERPDYWCNCGSGNLCHTCAAQPISSLGYRSGPSGNSGYLDSSPSEISGVDDSRSDDDRDDEDDKDKNSGGLWDGWLIRH